MKDTKGFLLFFFVFVFFAESTFSQAIIDEPYPYARLQHPSYSTIYGENVASVGEFIYYVASSTYGDKSGNGIGILHYENASWTKVGQIPIPEPSEHQNFGLNLIHSNGFLFVSSISMVNELSKGKVYVYEVSGSSYSLRQTLEAPAGSDIMNFGLSIDCDGSRLAIGASWYSQYYNEEAVLVYELSNSLWSLDEIIYEPSSGLGGINEGAHNWFGYMDVSVSGDLLLIPYISTENVRAGNYKNSEVRVYKRGVNGWELIQTLSSNGFLGRRIKIYNDICIISDHGNSALHIYNIDRASLSEPLILAQKIIRSDYFGSFFDFDDNLLVAGGNYFELNDSDYSDPRSHVYAYENGTWVYKRSLPSGRAATAVVKDDFIIIHNPLMNVYGLWAQAGGACYNAPAVLAVKTYCVDLSNDSCGIINYDDPTEGVSIRWYEDETSTTPIAYGNPFVTGQLTESRDYFIEADFYELTSPVRQRLSVCVAPEYNMPLEYWPQKDFFEVNEEILFSISPEHNGICDYGDGSTGTSVRHQYSSPGTYIVTFAGTVQRCSSCEYVISTTIKVIGPLCEFYIPSSGSGQFKMDKFTGNIVYERDECPAEISMGCMQGPAEPIPNVVSAGAVTFSDEWNYQAVYRDQYGTNPWEANTYETGTRGKWRVESSYVFNTEEIARDKNYNTGTFPLTTFNWQYPNVSEAKGWIRSSTIEHYSPHGDALQERNALDISSVAKFGYHNALPYLTAQNATYSSVCFESFENIYNTFYLEDGLVLQGTRVVEGGHSGKKSLEMAAGEQLLAGNRDYIVPKHTGMTIKLWAKGVVSGLAYSVGSYLDAVSEGEFKLLSRVGEWSLYEASFSSGDYTELQIRIDNNGPNTIYIDDLRIQPSESQMSAYVYDVNSLRLLTVFDDQHYGLFYHYNGEGKLVRKLLETERGTRTLQETFYNLPAEQ